MASNMSPEEQLRAENAALRHKLEEAEDTLRAIRQGEVDSIVVETEQGPRLFTLQGLDAESNHFRGELLAQVGDCVIAVDAEQHVIYVNAAAERQYRVPASDALGRQLGEIYSQQWPRTEAEAEMWAALRERGEWRGETIHRSHDGRDIAVETSVTALRDAIGRPAGYVGVYRDITERKQALELLRKSEERYRRVVETAHEGIWAIDAQGRITFVNQRMADLLGYAPAELMGRVHTDFMWEEDRPKGDVDLELRRLGLPQVWDQRYRRQDDSELWTAASGSALFDPDGKFIGALGMFADITARKQAEAALREADRRKDEFLATLAHELRNPLAPIRTAIHLLRKEQDRSPRIDSLAAMMERQVGHMVRLVDDLLDVSRVTSGKLLLQKDRVPVSSVVTNAVEAVRPLIKERGHTLSVTMPPAPIVLDLDLVRITQVISNLLNNAVKFTNPNGRIGVTVVRQPKEVVIVVSDTGVGLAPEDLPRIFDLFAQVDQSRGHSQGGLGIGLALSKRLVEMHGGTLDATSAGVGLGSEFLVRLPLISEAPPTPATVAPSKAENHLAPPTSRRILVVDDNHDGADTLSMLLRAEGHDIQAAYDGKAAVEVAEAFRPEVVLLDIGLPMMDGYDVCRHLRAQTWATGLVVIALTGWGSAQDRQRAQDAGIDHHLVKPVDPSAIRQVLATLGLQDRRPAGVVRDSDPDRARVP